MELLLDENQTSELFKQLDHNQDGFLNYQDWCHTITDDNSHLKYIKDAIYKGQLHADDVLKTMGLHREHSPVDEEQLIRGFVQLDMSLDKKKAQKVA